MANTEEMEQLLDGLDNLEVRIQEQEKPELEKTHPVAILMDEHKIILENLEELRGILNQVRAAPGFGEITTQLGRLKEIARLLLGAESHHQREEDALFPRLESHGVSDISQIMHQEHEELRARKRALVKLVEQAANTDYQEFSMELGKVGGYLTSVLKDHIFKEDNMLYPDALAMFKPEEWSEVAKECERIGYCYFTPTRKGEH
ncbi:MAG: hemerythrin domain-containing protein [Chloroflexi bacterium]|nr:hemerythrin domain-containing protein [Chloroflexota bacterium]